MTTHGTLRAIALFVIAAGALGTQTPARAVEVYLEPQAFLLEAFNGEVPAAARLWITNDLKLAVREVMSRDLEHLRVRYWRRGERTAWILEEIGKEQPITTGLVVDGEQLTAVRVLVYRESRGWEVRYPAFTEQFTGARLTDDRLLDRPIDGITGATMSVNALTRLARLALLLDEYADH